MLGALSPVVSTGLQALGALSAGCFLLSFGTVLLKAFVLPGISVRTLSSDSPTTTHKRIYYLAETIWSKEGGLGRCVAKVLVDPALISYNSLLVVTGASDGIGREFALQLAKAGFNILLAARNPEKLATVASEIRTLLSSHSFSSIVIDARGRTRKQSRVGYQDPNLCHRFCPCGRRHV